MVTVITELSKYVIIFFFAFYVISGFLGMGLRKKGLFVYQKVFLFLIQALAYLTLYLKSGEEKYIITYGCQLALMIVLMGAYRVLYPKMSVLIINNMCMLLTVGGIMLSRLSFAKGMKQFAIVTVSSLICMFVPVIIRKCTFLSHFTWVYALAGILLLALMKAAGIITYGANINFRVGGISIQPVEFVKIFFVFFLAAYLSRKHEFRDVLVVSVVAALHVLLLVWCRELGGALILFVTYVALLYVASHKYGLLGIAGGSGAAFVAYHLFRHVRVRVQTWSTPFSVIRNDTSQISQSLFAIGTGGWFGLGLMGGVPEKIPVVDEDLIFSAITEELGMTFAICLILLCLSTFIMFINIATKIQRPFYKMLAVGFGVEYGFQVILTIGGGTKFIPLTGVTLPLVSYGGSSVFCTLLIFAIIQGIYVMRQDEGEPFEYEDEYEYGDEWYDEDGYEEGGDYDGWR